MMMIHHHYQSLGPDDLPSEARSRLALAVQLEAEGVAQHGGACLHVTALLLCRQAEPISQTLQVASFLCQLQSWRLPCLLLQL